MNKTRPPHNPVLAKAVEVESLLDGSSKSIVHPVPNDPFDESVYNLIPIKVQIPPKQMMYKSKFASQAHNELKNGKKLAASMGPVKVAVNPPKQFLKKGDGKELHKPAQTFSNHFRAVVEPSVNFSELKHTAKQYTKDITPTKDFVKINALDNIHSIPKKTADETFQYRFKKNYGTVPGYLAKVIAEQEQIKQQGALDVLERDERQRKQYQLEQGIVPLPEEERIKVLIGLKANWEKLNSDYQKLSLTVDTVPKIAR